MRRAGHNCHPPCAERVSAQAAGEFLYLHHLQAWAFVDGPTRQPSTTVVVRYAYGKVDALPPHRGEPYRWHDCPWCGGDLIPPEP